MRKTISRIQCNRLKNLWPNNSWNTFYSYVVMTLYNKFQLKGDCFKEKNNI